MDTVKIIEGIELSCSLKGNEFEYYAHKDNGDSVFLGTDKRSPSKLTPSSNIGKDIFNYIKTGRYRYYDEIDKKNQWKEAFSKVITESESLVQKELKKEEENAEEYEKFLEEKYMKLHTHFEIRCKDNDYSPLQFLSQISQGLGVGLSIEVIKAFFGLYQTFLGLKGTNVIAIGNQSSGKSHIVETALDMLPQEKVHKGVTTVPYFFKKFNGQDLTGHIFYLGDLGGDNDDEDTLKLRDKLKQLTTDGWLERGLVEDSTPSDEYVKGYPCLVYTTTLEDMINAQERSRSMIITPPDIDSEKLEIFNFIMKNPGEYKPLIDTVLEDKFSVQGMVVDSLNKINNIECFNPYMFNITDYLKDIEDFNRKINEFNAILKLVCLLNNPVTVEHESYVNDDYEPIKTTMIVARKQDVLNALHLFDHNNDLLPTEVALANGLIKNFSEWDFTTPPVNIDDFSPSQFEDEVKKEIYYDKYGYVDWTDFTDVNGNPNDYFFTVSHLRSNFNNERWYRRNRDSLSNKLSKLYQSNILIKVGKTKENGYDENVYGLSHGLGKQIDDIKPGWGGEPFEKAKRLFKMSHPSIYDEVMNYIEKDVQTRVNSIDFEVEGSKLYDVPW